MKITAIELNFGYVESTSLANVVFFTNECFTSEKEAVESLASNLKAIYLDKFDETPKRKKCCKKKTTRFCCDCGTQLFAEEFDEDAFKQWLLEIPRYDLDSWGYNEVLDDGTEMIWEPGGSYHSMAQAVKDGYDVMALSNAEKVLCAGLNGKWMTDNESLSE